MCKLFFFKFITSVKLVNVAYDILPNIDMLKLFFMSISNNFHDWEMFSTIILTV